MHIYICTYIIRGLNKEGQLGIQTLKNQIISPVLINRSQLIDQKKFTRISASWKTSMVISGMEKGKGKGKGGEREMGRREE
jgi:hypothetical protein